MNNPKKTIQNIFLYFLIQVIVRNLLFTGLIRASDYLPESNVDYRINLIILILTVPVSGVITEIIMQKLIYKYVYKANIKQLDKYWWTEIIKIAALPLLVHLIICIIQLSHGTILVSEVDFIYPFIVVSNRLPAFQLLGYIIVFLIFNMFRLALCNYTCYKAYIDRLNDNLKNNQI